MGNFQPAQVGRFQPALTHKQTYRERIRRLTAEIRQKMLVGYMRVSTDSDRQVLDLQRDALVAAGVDERHLFEDRVSSSRGDRTSLANACFHQVR